jgi:hypothetical protein
MLSRELQQGKAAEHLVCFDLLSKGYEAFLAPQGASFDVVVVTDGARLVRVQVKSTSKLITTKKNVRLHYRFGLRNGKRGDRTVSADGCDVVAFVTLDTKLVGYVPIAQLTSKAHGGMVQAVDFYAGAQPEHDTRGRVYVNTGARRALWGKHLADYEPFPFGVG